MKSIAKLTVAAGGVAALCGLTACPSTSERTATQETRPVETQPPAARLEAEPAPAEARKVAVVVYFAAGSATLDKEALRQLRWFAGQMQPYPQVVIQVQGFSDAGGDEAGNSTLSLQRAMNVSSFLNLQGIALWRIVTQGFGTESAPALHEAGQEQPQNDRRVEVTVR